MPVRAKKSERSTRRPVSIDNDNAGFSPKFIVLLLLIKCHDIDPMRHLLAVGNVLLGDVVAERACPGGRPK
jgi:hypothetical protein